MSTTNFAVCLFACFWCYSTQWATTSSFTRFLDHTQRRITISRTPLDERSACRKGLYLTTHNTHKKQTLRHPVEFKPTISAGERPQIYTVDGTANEAGNFAVCNKQWVVSYVPSTCFDSFQFIIRVELRRHTNAANSVKDL